MMGATRSPKERLRKLTMNILRGNGLLTALLALMLALAPAVSGAEVRLPNGELVESVVDLQVKVRGGEVVVRRTWAADNVSRGEYRWHLNPAWDDLRFEYDPLDASVLEVVRAGSRFARTGDGVYVFDQDFFIRRTEAGWRWHDRGGNWIDYAATGQVQAWGNANLTVVSFQRDAEGRIQTLRDHRGQTVLSYHYVGSRVARISDHSGREVRYVWQGGQLAEVVDARGETWRYGYTGGLLSSITDPEGHARRIEYAGKRVWRVIDAEGNATSYEYDYDRRSRQYTVVERSPEGVRTEHRFDARGRLIALDVGNRPVMRLVRDGSHIEHRSNARGLRTTTEYDAHRNPIRVRHPDGSELRMRYEAVRNRLVERVDEAGVVTQFTYDARGNLTRLTEAAGLPEQRITEYTYNQYGERETRSIKSAGPNGEDLLTTWVYDAWGNVSAETNPANETTTYTHNAQGQVLTWTNAENETDTLGYDAGGLLRSHRDPLGHTTQFRYDKVGRRTEVIQPLAGGRNLTTTFGFLPNGWLETITDPEGGVTTFTYDRDGRRAAVIDQEGARTQFTYDAEGRLASHQDPSGHVTSFLYGAPGSGLDGLLVGIEYPSFLEEYRYDQRGRRTQTIRVLPARHGQPERRETTVHGFDPRGLRASETDPAQRTTQYRYDGLGRLAALVDPAQGETLHGYDLADNLVALTDAKGQTHRFTYDRAGRRTRHVNPGGDAIVFAYDREGRLTERLAPGGERRAYRYDAAGQLEEERHFAPGASSPEQVITYARDPVGRLIGYSQVGLVDSSAVYTLNGLGQILEEALTYGRGAEAVELSLGATFRANGQKASQRYPGGVELAFGFDQGNRLVRQALPDGNEISYDGFDWAGPTRIEGPGILRQIELDALQRPTRITVEGHAQPAPVMDYRYTYDSVGNITQRQTEEGTYAYTYDALDRLVRALPPETLRRSAANPQGLPEEVYDYDQVHNRITSAHQPGSWEYDINNRLQSWGVASQRTEITYDPNGHAVREARAGQVTDYVYSAHERLVEVRRNGQAVGRYQHDPFGRRIRKETAGQVTWFVYDEEGLVAELDAAGNARRIYGWVPDTMWGTAPVFQADAASNGWQTYVLHTDHLGTPQRATDSQGTVAWAMRSEAFGASTPLPESTIDVALRFPGQYYDTETGLHYNWQRDHSPLIGRYVQQDPIGLAGGINLYGYAEGNPITLFDPTGEAVPALIIKAGAMYVRCFVSCMGFETLSDYLFNDCFDLLGSAKENAGDCAVHCLNPFNWGGRAGMGKASMASGTSGGARAGKPFTRKGKAEIDAANAQRHGGTNVCETCGTQVVPGQRSQRGVTPPGNERHRDHIIPRNRGGDGDPSNGQILCRTCNLAKGG